MSGKLYNPHPEVSEEVRDKLNKMKESCKEFDEWVAIVKETQEKDLNDRKMTSENIKKEIKERRNL